VALRFTLVLLPALAAAGQQAAPAPLLCTVETVVGSRLQVKTAAGPLTLYADSRTEVWKGSVSHDLRPLSSGVQVAPRYHEDAAGKLVLDKVWADVAEFSGVVAKVSGDCFDVRPNREGASRPACFSRDTAFSTSAKDLTAGQEVRVIGLDLKNGKIQAARITIYNTDLPVDQ
jgi:hypothetical protein